LTLVVLPLMYDLIASIAERLGGRRGDLGPTVLSFRDRKAQGGS